MVYLGIIEILFREMITCFVCVRMRAYMCVCMCTCVCVYTERVVYFDGARTPRESIAERGVYGGGGETAVLRDRWRSKDVGPR